MKPFFKETLLTFADILAKLRFSLKNNIRIAYKPILAGIFSFCVVVGGIYITASRNMAIKQIKANILHTISYLNEFGLDIAYDDIEFNSMMFYPLVKIENLKLYSVTTLNDWAVKLKTVKAYPNLIGTKRIRFTSTDGGRFSFNEFSSDMSSEETFLDVITKNSKFDELMFHAENINIKDFAKIEKIVFLLRSEKVSEVSSFTTPSYTSMFEVNNVKINGLIDYPLSSNLKLIYAKANVMGKVIPDEFAKTSLENWTLQGGLIDIPNIILQWEPLTLVGRGDISFNENLSPKISFNTSSKGLLTLLNDLQKREVLDSSNVFIANIMLKNKAYKINDDDTELTISTPIGYSDKVLTIDNLPLKDFTK